MNTIKDYYIEIQSLYNKAVKMLTALDSAMSAQSASVPLTLIDDNSSEKVVNIPSFLYLENKLERFQEAFDSLVNIPETGEAWIVPGSKPVKLNILEAGKAPAKPIINNGLTAGSGTNSLFKDLVFPKMFLKMNLFELSPDITEVSFIKTVFFNKAVWENAKSTVSSLSTLNSYLSGYKEGIDWEQYESVIRIPVSNRDKSTKFGIISVLNDKRACGKITADIAAEKEYLAKYIGKQYWDVRLDNISYIDSIDSSRVRYLKPGMILSIDNGFANVLLDEVPYNFDSDVFRLVVIKGRLDIQPLSKINDISWSETYDTYLCENESTWQTDRVVNIPLEENEYITLSIASIRNGVRSNYTDPVFINLNDIYMTDETGSTLVGTDNKPISYINYYKQYARNIGDIITSLSYVSYPGVDSITPVVLQSIQNDHSYRPVININDLSVTAINNHLSDATALEELKSLHSQKQSLESELSAIRGDIENILSIISETDLSTNNSTLRANLSGQLKEAYSNRTTVEKQLIAIINEINTKANTAVIPQDSIKYRIRGHIDTTLLEKYLEILNLSLIGLDIQFKYKSISKDTVSSVTIGKGMFTSWNKYITPLKERRAIYNDSGINIIDYEPENNIDSIKWNQLDIPIQQGEDVIIRVRGIYNIGQPYIDIFTPWSEEVTITFPDNYTLNADIQNILSINKADTIDASFTGRLINDGYEEHITDKIIDNNKTFFHQPENIASGFFTNEQRIIPLREKLYEINDSLENINHEIDNIKHQSFNITAECNDKKIIMRHGVMSNIVLPTYLEHYDKASVGAFVEEIVNITISNTGQGPLRLYSIFPGDHNKLLSQVRTELYGLETGNYDIFPLYVSGSWSPQKMGQWIYFRNTNPYTQEYDNFSVTSADKHASAKSSTIRSQKQAYELLYTQMQQPLRYIPHEYNDNYVPVWGKLDISNSEISIFNTPSLVENNIELYKDPSIYFTSNFAGKYDGIIINKENILAGEYNYGLGIGSETSLDNKMSPTNTTYAGAFMFPDFPSNTNLYATSGDNELYYEIPSGSSISFKVRMQYYLTAEQPIVSKLLYFDLRPNLFQPMEHYMLQITAKYADATTQQDDKLYTDNI